MFARLNIPSVERNRASFSIVPSSRFVERTRQGELMAIYLKKAAGIEESDVADARVRETVERIISDVKQRGGAAVRELSEKLDGWSPADFRLSKSEIESLVGSVASSTIDDIKFAQTQVARFAESQKSALRNLELRSEERRVG